MIKRVRIENFQSHKLTEFFPSPRVTVFCGRNNSGKSSILRALRLLFYNKPDGSEFISWGAKDVEIEVEYSSHIIRRVKGTRNIYEVDGSTFSGFGKGVPQEVTDVLGFSSLQVDREVYELNFDHPHEAPFLISETDAAKGKMFSRLGERVLGDLLFLDKLIHVANTQLRKFSSEQQVLGSQIVLTKESLAVFEPLIGVELLLDSCRGNLAKADILEEEIDALKTLQEKLLQGDRTIDFLDRVTDIDLLSIEVKLFEVETIVDELIEFKQLKKDYDNTASSISKLEASCSILWDISEAGVTKIQQKLAELEDLLKIQISLKDVVGCIMTIELHCWDLQKTLEAALKSYKGLLMEAKKCPLCLRPVEEHDLDAIIKELVNDAR